MTRLAALSWVQAREHLARGPVVLVPVGSTEQHGPHLPCDVDNLIVQYYCDECARRQPELCTVAPLIPFGFNEHKIAFPGCITV